MANNFYQNYMDNAFDPEEEEEDEEEHDDGIYIDYYYNKPPAYTQKVSQKKYASPYELHKQFRENEVQLNMFDRKHINESPILYSGDDDLQEIIDQESSNDSFDMKTKPTQYTDQKIKPPLHPKYCKKDFLTESLPSNVSSDSSRERYKNNKTLTHGDELNRSHREVIRMEPVHINAETVHINQVSELQPSMYYSEDQYKNMSFGQDRSRHHDMTNPHNASRIIVINQK